MPYKVNAKRMSNGAYRFEYGRRSKKLEAYAQPTHSGKGWMIIAGDGFHAVTPQDTLRELKQEWQGWAAAAYERPAPTVEPSPGGDVDEITGDELDDLIDATPEPPTDPAGVTDFAVMRIASECRRYGVDAVAAIIERIRAGELPEKIAAEAMDRRIAAER